MTIGDGANWVTQAEVSIEAGTGTGASNGAGTGAGAPSGACGLWAGRTFLPHGSQMRVGAHNDGTQRKAEARGDWWCARGCVIVKKGPSAVPPERGVGILFRSEKR